MRTTIKCHFGSRGKHICDNGDGEGETTSKADNKCQPKTEFEKSTSGIQKAENQETSKVIQDVETQKSVEDNFDAKQKGQSLEKPCSNEEPVQTEVKENRRR